MKLKYVVYQFYSIIMHTFFFICQKSEELIVVNFLALALQHRRFAIHAGRIVSTLMAQKSGYILLIYKAALNIHFYVWKQYCRCQKFVIADITYSCSPNCTSSDLHSQFSFSKQQQIAIFLLPIKYGEGTTKGISFALHLSFLAMKNRVHVTIKDT